MGDERGGKGNDSQDGAQKAVGAKGAGNHKKSKAGRVIGKSGSKIAVSKQKE